MRAAGAPDEEKEEAAEGAESGEPAEAAPAEAEAPVVAPCAEAPAPAPFQPSRREALEAYAAELRTAARDASRNLSAAVWRSKFRGRSILRLVGAVSTIFHDARRGQTKRIRLVQEWISRACPVSG